MEGKGTGAPHMTCLHDAPEQDQGDPRSQEGVDLSSPKYHDSARLLVRHTVQYLLAPQRLYSHLTTGHGTNGSIIIIISQILTLPSHRDRKLS